jgi:23S rRNA pseudouridine1911/1915/1917 synthase
MSTQSSQIRILKFSASNEHAGQRLDRVLSTLAQDYSRSRLKGLIESSHVRLDGTAVTDPNHRVTEGAAITLTVPSPVPDKPLAQELDLDVRFEDEHLIVINKPAGMVVHPAAGNADGTLVNALLAHCGGGLQGIGGVKRPGIVHRLDKDTSGLLVAAKTEKSHVNLTEQFSTHSIHRQYEALAWGVPAQTNGTIEGLIGRSPRNRKKMAVVNKGGKNATTHYKVEEVFGSIACRVYCTLETGRTHQIRVHMTHIGHGLIGDNVYGTGLRRGTPDQLKDAVKAFGRQALHAQKLGFMHPVSGQKLDFQCERPDDMDNLMTALRAASSIA